MAVATPHAHPNPYATCHPIHGVYTTVAPKPYVTGGPHQYVPIHGRYTYPVPYTTTPLLTYDP
jgi:hypothetical protein